MFNVLKGIQEDIARETWTAVNIMPGSFDRILNDEIEEEGDDFLGGMMSTLNMSPSPIERVNKILESWCKENIKGGFIGGWSTGPVYRRDENMLAYLRFQFQKPKEAVRFKLTWGGE